MNSLITLLFHDVYIDAGSESGFAGVAAERYKLSLAQFRAQLSAVARERDDPPVRVTGRWSYQEGELPFAISVDDGGVSYHSLVAPCLAEYGWLGHCLVTTNQIGKPAFLHKHHIRELHAAGHLIGSHSATHPDRIHRLGWQQLVEEWAISKAVLEDIVGAPVLVGSIPGGYYARQVAMAARSAGLEFLFSSEPETSPFDVGGCRVYGRYTLRRQSALGLSGELVGLSSASRRQQWLEWNSKKALKKVLGASYAGVSNWLAR